MAKIISIQTRDNIWYSIEAQFDDGHEETLLLDQEALVTYGFLSKGEVEEAKLRAASQQQELIHAYQKAVRYLGYRMRARSEIITYLLDKEHSLAIANQTCARLEEQGYINDAIFAKAYVREQILLSDKGPKVLRDHLRKLKIADGDISVAIETYTQEEQDEKIAKLIRTAMRRSVKDSQWHFKQKLQMKIIQKGFATEDVKAAIATIEWDAERQDEALQKQAQKVVRVIQKYEDDYEQKTQFMRRMLAKGFSYEACNEWYAGYLEEQDE